MMEGPGADSEEKHEPVSDIDTAVVVVGLKALDPEWPIREAIGEERTWPDLSPPDWARVERAYVLSRLQALWSGQVDKIIIRSSRRVFAGIGAT
jgi:hypothetical protein